MQPFQQLKHGPSILLVQISGGFICQQNGRLGDERPSYRDALLFPSGKLPCAVVGSIREPYFREPLRAFSSVEAKFSPRNNSGIATFSAAVKSGNN